MSVNSTCPATHSASDPRPAEALPGAVRHLLQDHQPRAAQLLRLAIRRFDIRTSDVSPLDCPAVPDRHVFRFRNVAQHLGAWPSVPALVARPNGRFADFWRPALYETNAVIGPQVRQGNRISRQSRGCFPLVELLDAG